MSAWNYIFFDMDGTLIDSAPIVTKRFAETFKSFGVAVPSDKELHSLVGPSAAITMEKYLGASRVAEGVARYREIAREQGISELLPFEGISAMVKSLSDAGLKMAVATSKPEVEALEILRNVELLDFMDAVSGASDSEGVHLKSDVISRALDRLKPASKQNCLMVGDRIFDIEGAKECGLESVFVSWGGADTSEAHGALAIVENPSDLRKFILDEHFE